MIIQWPHHSLQQEWESGVYHRGCTEPWTVQVIAAFACAKHAPHVLETGGYVGTTSAWLALAVAPSGGKLTVFESDPVRCQRIIQRMVELRLSNVRVMTVEALRGIQDLSSGSIDIAYLDDDHSADHVHREIGALLPKMAPGGIILGHDVIGPLGLGAVFKSFGGVCVDLPRIHAAGGLGIIQT